MYIAERVECTRVINEERNIETGTRDIQCAGGTAKVKSSTPDSKAAAFYESFLSSTAALPLAWFQWLEERERCFECEY